MADSQATKTDCYNGLPSTLQNHTALSLCVKLTLSSEWPHWTFRICGRGIYTSSHLIGDMETKIDFTLLGTPPPHTHTIWGVFVGSEECEEWKTVKRGRGEAGGG